MTQSLFSSGILKATSTENDHLQYRKMNSFNPGEQLTISDNNLLRLYMNRNFRFIYSTFYFPVRFRFSQALFQCFLLHFIQIVIIMYYFIVVVGVFFFLPLLGLSCLCFDLHLITIIGTLTFFHTLQIVVGLHLRSG